MVPAAAYAQPAGGRDGEARASFDLVRAYLAGLRNPAGEAPAVGPREFRVERAGGASAETVPIARLARMLRNCRKASFSAAWGNPQTPKRVEGHQAWECLGEGAEDKSVLVTAVSMDGKTIESVAASLGAPISWPGPAPSMGPPPSPAQTAEFQARKTKVFAFLDALGSGQSAPSVAEIVLWVGQDRRSISAERAKQKLGNCDRRFARPEDTRIDGERRVGVVVTWKCDERSTAYADLQGLITVKEGAVDRFYLSPYLDYSIPPAADGK
jgi:hypothetical protein